ncbi:hypothetical protein [Chondromyces apiculatus]|uniref:Lipoprotein n=1 Tax=Chondromyces apiculatus DSM 436 TaxID=1192034 RepID=A0A017T1S8_9BACT|nr:hypothetical protein [Chondromyces apiculatus]EYF02805.1 Hypothetical protein CAP_6540 [Chondromyces apiculatus DSM 436]
MIRRAAALALPVFASATVVAGGCAQQAVTVDVRSLERSGRSSFVCLAAPGEAPGLPLTACSRRSATSVDDYGVDEEGNTTLPHLYALVTQTTRGEVAVVDMSTTVSPVLDQDPGVPGANFLHVGALPVDIVSTTGGTATFVATAEVGREGLFALPSHLIRPAAERPPTELNSWPACSLPSAPGEILLVVDPAGPEGERGSCDVAYGASYVADEGEPVTPYQHGDLSAEGLGRQKLVVTLPEMGGFVVIDAQRLLDRHPGSYASCPVERWVPLKAEVPPPGDPPSPPPAAACVNPELLTPSTLPLGAPRPAGIALSGERLFVADLELPLVHAIDMATPCAPVERPPLVTGSMDDPTRVVTTTRIAVSNSSTVDFRRYLYAVDADEGDLMVFDVSDGATQRTPIARPHPEWNPFIPPDRVRFNAPVRDILIIDRDLPVVDPETGVATTGIRCDPNPTLDVCSDTADPSCDLETLYRTSAAFDSGASPTRLRGTFAFALLTNAQISVIDIDDLDASCRGPKIFSETLGCSAVGPSGHGPPPNAPPGDMDADGIPDATDLCPFHYDPDQANSSAPEDSDGNGPQLPPKDVGDRCQGEGSENLASTNEPSCNVVVPNTPRSLNFVFSSETSGLRGEPGLLTLPLLYDRAGTALSDDDEQPKMRAPLPADPDTFFGLAVGAQRLVIDTAPDPELDYLRAGQIDGRNALRMNLEDPRAHIANQAWAVTYEGALPGFSTNAGSLRCVEGACDGADAREKRWDLYDTAGLFCGRGVQSAESVREQLEAAGEDASEASVQALSDFLAIVSDLPDESNAHWSDPSRGTCTYDSCRAEFGLAASPSPRRELTIREAYQDHLVLDPPTLGGPSSDLNCCFPGSAAYQVRGRSQWIATSQVTGFLHHVIVDPVSSVCRNSCDSTVARMNARVRSSTSSTPGCALAAGWPDDVAICEGDPRVLTSPMMKLAITEGRKVCGSAADCPGTPCQDGRCLVPPQRDMQFRFATQGAFVPLIVNLAAGGADIQPQSMRFLPATGELAVTDGSLEGLMMILPGSLSVSRQYY